MTDDSTSLPLLHLMLAAFGSMASTYLACKILSRLDKTRRPDYVQLGEWFTSMLLSFSTAVVSLVFMIAALSSGTILSLVLGYISALAFGPLFLTVTVGLQMAGEHMVAYIARFWQAASLPG